MSTIRRSAIERRVSHCVAKRREILAAYVFGSAARGQMRADSDVDVAVLLAKPLPATRRLKYRLQLMAELGSALERSDVDIVILNDAPPLLAHRVLATGRLVFERSASARVRFQVRTASLYFDMLPMFETHIRYLKRHARESRVSG